MSPEKQRIAIAEACGWKHVQGEEPTYGGKFMQSVWISPSRKRHGTNWRKKDALGLPDYLSDLNAIHEAKLECLNSPNLQDSFACSLAAIMDGRSIDYGTCQIHCSTAILFATAAQQSKALLRAIGKWEGK